MKKYLFMRVIKSIISIFIVVAIVIAMLFKGIPANKVFDQDKTYNKLQGNAKTIHRYNTLDQLGYLDYKTIGAMCSLESKDANECLKEDSSEQQRVINVFKDKGFNIEKLTKGGINQGQYIATREFGLHEIIFRYFKQLFDFDHPNKIVDETNPKLDENRGYYFGTDHNGIPALMCNGCEYKYQLYFNTSFPFIHSNFLSLNFGNSFPTKPGTPTLEVITTPQGPSVRREVTYPTGLKANTADDLYSLRYKKNTDHLDEQKFKDKYAEVDIITRDPSMVGTSYLFGIVTLILAYAFALPAGIAMARNKGKLVDKIGILYINILIALPSLAFIFFMKYLGSLINLPDKFPQLGPSNIKSYIMPVLILTILSTSGIMTWIRRYMIDQSTSDYVKFARAKGLSQKEIFKNHILKNAIIPIVNGIPGSIVLAIGGAVITESVFAIPGMGKMLPDAINSVNNNMVITLTFIFTTLSIFSLLAGDILLTMVDPRISLNAKKGDI
ncbi:ABC transporter permease [Helcococcus bovis]|uniref:ABC transporter permease n=1 Tax=Helcococcus TaxID=31983 RepID=UPI0038BD97DF